LKAVILRNAADAHGDLADRPLAAVTAGARLRHEAFLQKILVYQLNAETQQMEWMVPEDFDQRYPLYLVPSIYGGINGTYGDPRRCSTISTCRARAAGTGR